jgi:CheY-like chemotaxis protein
LTEDIVANQLVTATLLRREGHHVDIAASGPAAIKAMQTAPYDLVFMDIFMPGMSGQEATRIIRALPEPARSTPIVALTANVAPEDEALFKASGMDGLLGKPVSLAKMLDVLRRFVWQPQRGASGLPYTCEGTLESSAVVEPPAAAVLSAERINELRTNLPPSTFADLMEECLVDMDHRLPALRRALVAGVPAAVNAQAHAMVGMAAGYGMAARESRLRHVMSAAQDANLPSLGPGIVAALEDDFAQAATTLREMLRTETV